MTAGILTFLLTPLLSRIMNSATVITIIISIVMLLWLLQCYGLPSGEYSHKSFHIQTCTPGNSSQVSVRIMIRITLYNKECLEREIIC